MINPYLDSREKRYLHLRVFKIHFGEIYLPCDVTISEQSDILHPVTSVCM